MRVSVVPVALAGFVVAIVPTGGREMRPLPLTAGPPTPSLALVWKKDDGVRLAHLDARKMRVGKARSPQLDYVDAWTFDPDHRLLAFTSNPTQWGVLPDVLRFVQPSTLRFTPARTTLAAPARALLWARPDRIVAVEVDCCDAPQIVVETIDVAIASVVSTQRLDVRVVRRPRAASDSVEPHRRRDAACRWSRRFRSFGRPRPRGRRHVTVGRHLGRGVHDGATPRARRRSRGRPRLRRAAGRTGSGRRSRNARRLIPRPAGAFVGAAPSLRMADAFRGGEGVGRRVTLRCLARRWPDRDHRRQCDDAARREWQRRREIGRASCRERV